MARKIGSILHGAYGDYYWQATSLRLFAERHPGARLYLFASEPDRRLGFEKMDLSFAECFSPWEDMLSTPVDEFLQYQVFDLELQQDVLAHLPADVLAKIDRTRNRIFWTDLRGSLPLKPSQRLQLSAEGRRQVPAAMERYGIPEDLFRKRKTVAFVWRYRGWNSAIKPIGQPSCEALVEKYSRVFRRLIDDFDCHFLVTGMNPVPDEADRHCVDPKYAPFGLDLPPERCTYLKGKGRNWALDLDILSRCTAAAAMASGMSEALDAHRGGGAVLMDPPLHYMLVLVKYRVALHQFMTPRGFYRIWSRPHSEGRLYRWIAEDLKRAEE
ncbi:MAG: hypothetical protein ACLQBJ_05225 [Bryobacteraceae bacterium]